ncbi:MAG: hypothetical protein AAB074_21650 [Planctomycetota bacterium]
MRNLPVSAFLLAILSGCDSKAPPPSTGTPVAGRTIRGSVSREEGGRVGEADSATLTVPPGAVDRFVQVSLQKEPAETHESETVHLAGAVWSFRVNDEEHFTFSKPVRLTLPLDPSLVFADTPVGLSVWQEGAWQEVPEARVEAGQVVADVDHFSKYAPTQGAGKSASQENLRKRFFENQLWYGTVHISIRGAGHRSGDVEQSYTICRDAAVKFRIPGMPGEQATAAAYAQMQKNKDPGPKPKGFDAQMERLSKVRHWMSAVINPGPEDDTEFSLSVADKFDSSGEDWGEGGSTGRVTFGQELKGGLAGKRKEMHQLEIDIAKGTYSFEMGQIRAGDVTLTKTGDEVPFTPETVPAFVRWQLKDRKLPSSGSVLTGTMRIPRKEFGKYITERGDWKFRYGSVQGTITWTLSPEPLEDVVLEIKPENYDKWLPEGGADEKTRGNSIRMKATLRRRDGGTTTAKLKTLELEINGVSREKGVCLNFPLKDGAETPDLKFAAGTGFTLEKEDTFLRKEGKFTEVDFEVESFDWGGWGAVTGLGILTDGRPVWATLEGDPSLDEVRLPKRTEESKVADAWKKDNKVEDKADADDAEQLIKAGKAPGDGFALYEEYRGFMENGKHLKGDPRKIDFFVRNYVGGDAVVGIERFAQLTGALVHHELNDAEFDRETRVMNANHTQGAHAVDQHGVYLLTESGTDGAVTVFTVAGVRGRPKITKGISVQPRGASTSITTSENLPAFDLMSTYDIAIAHELLHSVGVEHHGKGDERKFFTFFFADDPGNPTGKAAWKQYDHFVTILDETTGRDLAAEMESAIRRKLESQNQAIRNALKEMLKQRPDVKLTDKQLEDFLKVDSTDLRCWYVGAQGGECSGDDGCVMRYFFARLYEKKSDPSHNTFYYISKKPSERLGRGLCRSALGTGVNASGHKPQPRYGNAMGGCGACADWIVFNDAVPPDPEPVEKK